MKNGFTLVEILAVIVLIALISLIAFPKVTEIFNKRQVEASEQEKELLYLAASEYYEDHKQYFQTGLEYYCVTIADLINDGKLIDPVIDVATGLTLSNDVNIEITIANNQANYDYNTSRCES